MKRADVISSLVSTAEKYVGVTELGGDNSGPQIEIFQKAVDNKAQRESWCAGFVFHCLKETLSISASGIFPSEHCLTIWNKTPVSRRKKRPEVGDIVVWQFYKNNKPTNNGHTGIVTKVLSDSFFETIEGNTGPGKEIERNGDGVYRKKRLIAGSSTMKILGFLRPF